MAACFKTTEHTCVMDKKNWFTEVCEESGSAFSLQISEKLHEEQTDFQKIEVYKTEQFGHLMVIDGFIMLSQRDNFLYHEMMAHPVLYTHKNPKRIVVIGGGDCGTLSEALKHPGVEYVLQVEIDERVTRLSETYFPELTQSNNDPRAEFFFGDGIKWMEDAADNSIDVIIIDSTDPIGPAEGLFRAPFYRQCRRVLGQHGLLVQQSESPLIHQDLLVSMRSEMHAAGFAQQQTLCYPQPVYPSGWWSATIAGQNSLTRFRLDDINAKPFTTHYYNAEIHQAALATPEFLKQHFRP